MYVYCQNGDGGMHEGCLHQDVNDITRDQMALLHARGWRYGALKGSCAAGSALCGMSWGSPPNRAIFYQTDDKAIRQMSCCDGQDWHTSGFAQTDVMPGTQMTEVHNENVDRVVLFFQDKDGFLCRRRAIDWCWEDAVRLCKAAPLTPISATTWSETEDIRVYFQDQYNVFREFQGSFDGAWTMGDFALRSNKIHRSVAAISWLRSEMKPGAEIRVYIQDHTNTVIEWYYSVNCEWTLGEFGAGAPPDTDIAALQRDSGNDAYVHVYWTSYDKTISQKVWTRTLGWLSETFSWVWDSTDYKLPSIQSPSEALLTTNGGGAPAGVSAVVSGPPIT
ncbi:hypothetical protein K438DRAFT_1855291 [Mycena galopus ATCC 62051]|nr:hypothetical protein K438DRAFT_1855291 [Mycena galopus ATCC 62051]